MSKIKVFAIALILFSNTAVSAVRAQALSDHSVSSNRSTIIATAGIGAPPVAEGGLWKALWWLGKLAFTTFITWSMTESLTTADEVDRHEELRPRIAQIETQYYEEMGEYIPVSEQTVSQVMNLIGAETQDRSFVSQEMTKYLH